MSGNNHEPLVILRRRQVETKTGFSRSTIYRRMQAGTFPLAISLGGRMVGWRAGEIDRFLANPARYRVRRQECVGDITS